jgi:hypothetical protein
VNVLYLLSLDRTANLVFWSVLVHVGAFYMQRLHHETLTEWGTERSQEKWLAAAGSAMGWLAYACVLLILYRVGIVAAIVALLAMFFFPVAISTLDVWLVRSPAKPMAMVAAPLTAGALIMMLRAAFLLS